MQNNQTKTAEEILKQIAIIADMEGLYCNDEPNENALKEIKEYANQFIPPSNNPEKIREEFHKRFLRPISKHFYQEVKENPSLVWNFFSPYLHPKQEVATQTISHQLCPKCYGEGVCDNIGTSTSVKRMCPVCNGSKTLINTFYQPIKQEVAMPSEWISVKDRLPEVGKGIENFSDDVLTYNSKGETFIYFYNVSQQTWGEGHDITHWQKLPSPPQTEIK
jgi:hypothetical protein